MLDLLRRNLGLKIFAFLLAYMVWLHVAGSGHQIRVLDLPLDIEASPSLIVSSYTPSTVQVRVRGPESQMARLVPERLFVLLNLDPATEAGMRDYSITRDQIKNLPRGITIDDIVTDTVRVGIERRVEKVVRVTPRLVGDPASGFRLYEVEVEPGAASVRGPESVLEGLEAVATTRVDISGRSEGDSLTARLERPANSRHVDFPEGDEVRVSYEILDEPAATSWTMAVSPPEGFTVLPAEVKVSAQMPPSQAEALRALVGVRLETEGLSSRGGLVRIRPDLSRVDERRREWIRGVRIEPSTVRLRPAS